MKYRRASAPKPRELASLLRATRFLGAGLRAARLLEKAFEIRFKLEREVPSQFPWLQVD